MGAVTRRTVLAGTGASLALASQRSIAYSSGWLDDVVGRTMAAFDVPGVAIGLVAPGHPVIAQGWGVRTLGEPERVDAGTTFAIASHSKAITASAVAMLVDAGTIAWDAPLRTYLPDFRMFDRFASDTMTVRDLLVHCSGLGLGAGDLMFFPRANVSRGELVDAIRYLKPVASFRSGYAYDNILYVVAGAMVEAVTGQSWEAFVASRVFGPLGMNDTYAAPSLVPSANRAAAHGRIDGPARGLGHMQRLTIVQDRDHVAPAGGVHSCARDMARWLRVQLDQGHLDGRRLWSEAAAQAMWTPRTIIRATAGPSPRDPGLPILEAYALGWKLRDYRGMRVVAHTGFLQGAASATMMIPSLGLGISVLTNAEETGAHAAIINSVADHVLGAPAFDWIGFYKQAADKERADALAPSDHAAIGQDRNSDVYAGRYRDPWYGDILVTSERGALTIDFTRSPDLKGALSGQGKDRFVTSFGNREIEDAVVTFVFPPGVFPPGEDRPSSLKITAKSRLADFSYDYQDLDPKRV